MTLCPVEALLKYNKLASTSYAIPYANVRTLSNWMHQPVAQVGQGQSWMHQPGAGAEVDAPACGDSRCLV